MEDHEILEQESHSGHAGWFMRGFLTAVALVAGFLYFSGYFGSADTSELNAQRTIIVGK